jgi:hypothetical protein
MEAQREEVLGLALHCALALGRAAEAPNYPERRNRTHLQQECKPLHETFNLSLMIRLNH